MSDSISSSRAIDTPATPMASGSSAPNVALPSGGGAIRGMGEKFSAGAATGTSNFEIPITTTPSRLGFSPNLSLSYSSGGGNGAFGLGWSMSVPQISRKTDKGLPRYQDGVDSDVFLLSEAEDLVPVTMSEPEDRVVGNYKVRKYRPRIEGLFARIERLSHVTDTGDVYWRMISKENETSIFGRDDSSRVFLFDGSNKRIFSWLLSETYDSKGNAALYTYKAENDDGIDLTAANEQNRTIESRGVQRYLKSVKYGNRVSNRDLKTWNLLQQPLSEFPQENWCFEVILDYGEHPFLDPKLNGRGSWICRQDPFSSFRAGFEVRTYRLCHRILMFHHFPDDLGVQDYLVSGTELTYEENANISYLTKATSKGFVLRDGTVPAGPGLYFSRSFPPIEFQYSKAPDADALKNLVVHEVGSESLESLPAGVDGQYEWLDLYSEGLDGVFVVQGEQWYFKPNVGAGEITSSLKDRKIHSSPRFGALELVPTKSSLNESKPLFMDLAGDGRVDIVEMHGPVRGFFHGNREINDAAAETWAEFQPFAFWPNVDPNDPNLKFLDLTGNGLADMLISEDNVFRFYPSLGEAGFGSVEHNYHGLDEEKGPQILFSDPTESIYLADLSGDGMLDICRIRNANICYWPNLGYGRFGAKVTMDAAPTFDRDDMFNHRRVLLCDIDGSGTTDLIYLGTDRVSVYFNQSGNRWSEAHALDVFLPPVDTLSSITAVDLLGNGTSCLVWSSSNPCDTRFSLRYIDLANGMKPHLLTGFTNNLGAETRLSYLPSTSFYLRDKAVGKPWATRLPYPIQCVEMVRVYDEVSQSYQTTRYAYHHGYFDGQDREFRGFGMVEQWDTENIDILEADSPNGAVNIDRTTHAPPIYTKRWFHTGAFADHDMLQRRYAREYFGGRGAPENAFEKFYIEEVLRDNLISDGTLAVVDVTGEDAREASRCLKGRILREELYAQDDTPKADLPYVINDVGYNIVVMQLKDSNASAVCRSYQREEIKYMSERTIDDPRIEHNLTLDMDQYGNPRKSANIWYGRRPGKTALLGKEKIIQETTKIMYSELEYTNFVDTFDDYRIPIISGTRSYEITGFQMEQGAVRFGVDTFSRDEFASVKGLVEIPYNTQGALDVPQKRMTARTATRYRSNDLSQLLPNGTLESLALTGITYSLCFTSGVQSLFTRSGENLVPDLRAVFPIMGGYVDLENDQSWWQPTNQLFYHSSQTASPELELQKARETFFTPLRTMNPFGKHTITTYDAQSLLVSSIIDAIGNVRSFSHDYRTLKPKVVTDANGNRTAFAFDSIGQTVGTAVMGKSNDLIQKGDSLEGFQVELSDSEIESFVADPLAKSSSFLGNATCRFVHDLNRFYKNTGKQKSPVLTSTLHRQQHVSDGTSDGRIQITFIYSDGFGREIQKKMLVEPDPSKPSIPRWVGSAWKIYNNKGAPVKVFEPFFDSTHDFKFDQKEGVSPIFMYDALGRVVATAFPNKSWTKEVYGSWQTLSYDANDTILQDPKTDLHVGQFFRLLQDEEYLPTWYNARKDGGKGALEQQAAVKTALHDDTPSSTDFDALGNAFIFTSNNGGQERYMNLKVYDIQGYLKESRDAQDRIVQINDYSMLGHNSHTASMDAGERWILHDILGNEILSWDSRNHRWRSDYDALRRPTATYLQQVPTSQLEILYNLIVYGESVPDAAIKNLCGQVFRIYDQAGIESNVEYDFKGNLLSNERQLAANYKTELDWSDISKNQLEPEIYTGHTSYDALDRIVTLQAPDKSIVRRVYNQGDLIDSIQVNLKGEIDHDTGLPIWQSYVANVDYNAKAQAILIMLGNNARIENAYDPLTDHLTNQTASTPNKGTVTTLQNSDYIYDPVGNIVSIQNNSQQTIFFRNRVVSPHAGYTYDPLYRLIEATGREHLGQTKGLPNAPTAPGAWQNFASAVDHPGDGNAMGTYIESYVYDSVNNILATRHRTDNPNYPGWTRRYLYEEKSQLEEGRVNNRLSQTSVGTIIEKYVYEGDAGIHGNMTSMPHLPFMHWDAQDRLRATAQQVVGNGGNPEKTWYVYSAKGQRVRKVTERQSQTQTGIQGGSSPTILRERIYLGIFEIYRKYNGNGKAIVLQSETLHVETNNGRLALIEDWTGDASPGRLIRYQLIDHLDSVVIELSETSELISYEEYTPYGNTTYQTLLKNQPKRYRWMSKERDKENGFYYCEARYLAPWLGRWTAADPAGIEDGLNIFCYVGGNPISYVDPTGLGLDAVIKRFTRSSTKEERKRLQIGKSSDSSHGGDSRSGPTTRSRTAAFLSKASSLASSASSWVSSVATKIWKPGRKRRNLEALKAEQRSLISTPPSKSTALKEGSMKMKAAIAKLHPRTELHHVYPQEFEAEFHAMGIEIDVWTIALRPEVHQILTNGDKKAGIEKWNNLWQREFFEVQGGYNDIVEAAGGVDKLSEYDKHTLRREAAVFMRSMLDRHGLLVDDHQFLIYKDYKDKGETKYLHLVDDPSWITARSAHGSF